MVQRIAIQIAAVFIVLSFLAACTADEDDLTDGDINLDGDFAVDGNEVVPDGDDEPDLDAEPEMEPETDGDAPEREGIDPEDFPPSTDWWDTGSGTCLLPGCDASAESTLDLNGSWIQTVTTVSTDCSATVALVEERAKVDNIYEYPAFGLIHEGQCVEKEGKDGLFGILVDDKFISCEINDQLAGSFSLETSSLTWADGKATGTAMGYLFNLPLEPDHCTIDFTVDLQPATE